jgi:hypothetical protein
VPSSRGSPGKEELFSSIGINALWFRHDSVSNPRARRQPLERALTRSQNPLAIQS